MVKVTGAHGTRVSLAAPICVRQGQRPRLSCRVHRSRAGRAERRKGFTEIDYAAVLDAAHQQLGGGLVVVWDYLTTHLSRAMAELIAARNWLTACQLPPYAHEPSPAGLVWSHLKRSLAKRNLAQLTALVTTRLKPMQYRPGLLEGFGASTRLDRTPLWQASALRIAGHSCSGLRSGPNCLLSHSMPKRTSGPAGNR